MIGSLRGRLALRSVIAEPPPPTVELLVEVYGVGYRVKTTSASAGGLGPVDSEVLVYVHHVVREDDESLYGFSTHDECSTFEVLIGTHRIGPSLALAVLDAHDPEALRRAVAADDVDALCMVHGVGPKTAVRLLVELKARLRLPQAAVPPGSADGTVPRDDPVRADVRSALAGLGYDAGDVNRVMADLPAEGGAEEALVEALNRLAGG